MLYSYLESEVKVGEVGVLGCLEHVSLEMHVCNFVHLHYLLLINLFERKEIVVQVH